MSNGSLPRISVIMVDGSFRESFHSIDFFADQSLPPHDYELIWVEYYDKVHPELAAKIAQHPNFRYITLNRDGLYHSSYCFNRGILESRAELLVIPDADVVVEPDFLEQVWQSHQSNDRLAMYLYRYNEEKNDHQDKVDLDHLRQVCQQMNPQNYGGCLTVRKTWLLEINGYEQHPIFETAFHANGYDIYSRLKALGLHVMWHPTVKMYHPWHPNTSHPSPHYELQQVITGYRARKLITLACEGLDSGRNAALPPDLLQEIEAKRNEQKTPNIYRDHFLGRSSDRVKDKIKRLFNR